MYSLFLSTTRLVASLLELSFSNGAILAKGLEDPIERRARSRALAAQAELADEAAVALDVGALEVAQQAAALADQHQQAAA